MRFGEASKLKAAEILKLLQEQICKNTLKLKSNNEYCQKNLKENSDPKERLKMLSEISAENKMLTEENCRFLDLHTRLISLLKALQDEGKTEEKTLRQKTETMEDYEKKFEAWFQSTTHEEAVFDEKHPFFRDEAFRKRLIKYYISQEEYEKCAVLQQQGSVPDHE